MRLGGRLIAVFTGVAVVSAVVGILLRSVTGISGSGNPITDGADYVCGAVTIVLIRGVAQAHVTMVGAIAHTIHISALGGMLGMMIAQVVRFCRKGRHGHHAENHAENQQDAKHSFFHNWFLLLGNQIIH